MRYSRLASLAIASGLIANIYQAISGTHLLILSFVNGLWLLILMQTAVRYYKDNRTGFDPVVAAETIVAFGVASLILSMASAIYPMLALGPDKIGSVFTGKGNGLLTVGTPFIEGLATAGFAPLLAMVVRNRVSELDGASDPAGDAGGLGRAMANLTREMEATRTELGALQSSLTRAASSTRTLADNIETESGRLKLVLLEAQSEIKGFGGAAHDGRDKVGGLATETARLKTAVTETGTLFEALTKLIESVERFVTPGTRRRK